MVVSPFSRIYIYISWKMGKLSGKNQGICFTKLSGHPANTMWVMVFYDIVVVVVVGMVVAFPYYRPPPSFHTFTNYLDVTSIAVNTIELSTRSPTMPPQPGCLLIRNGTCHGKGIPQPPGHLESIYTSHTTGIQYVCT